MSRDWFDSTALFMANSFNVFSLAMRDYSRTKGHPPAVVVNAALRGFLRSFIDYLETLKPEEPVLRAAMEELEEHSYKRTVFVSGAIAPHITQLAGKES